MKISGLRSLWRFRSLIGSTSYESFANPKITAEKLIRKQGPVRPDVEIMHTSGVTEQTNLLEGKLQQAVNENAKLKVKQTENSKLRQGLCSNVSSARRLCDQLTALQQLANHTEQAEEGKKFFEQMLGKNSNGLDELNCLLNDLSTELDHAEQMHHTRGATEQSDLLEEKLQQAVNENAKLKVKQTENSKLWQGLCSNVSSARRLCDQLTALQQLASHTEQAEEGMKFFEEMLRKNSNGLDELNCLLNDLSTELDHAEQKIVSDNLEQASVKTYLGMVEAGVQPDNTLRAYDKEETRQIHSAIKNPMISGILRPQISYIQKTNWSFHKRSFHGTPQLAFGRKRKQSEDSKIPGNTARIVLNPDDLIGSKYSYRNGIRKARSWCKSKSTAIDLSSYFGPGEEVYTTPENGTFHVTFEYKGREITFFISGRDLYIRGWEVDKVKIFEIRDKNDKSEKFIQDPRCIPIEMGVNYCDICKGLGFVRVGFQALIDNFEVLHKSSSLSNAVMEAVAVFAVNGPEAVRFEWVLEDISEAFDSNLELDSKRTLSCYVRKYAHYSCEYLTYVHHITNGLPVPEITNRYGGKIRDIYELRSLLSIPLRTALKKTSKKAKKEEYKSPIWSPPYPDGKDWLLKEEEQEQMEEQLIKEEEQEQMEQQEETQVENQQKMEDHSIGGSIIRCMSFVNAGAPGVQINILPSGYPSWLRIAKFLRWFIR